MQFKRMLLMCSALITAAYSFPTEAQHNITTLSQNATNVADAKENRKPLVVIMEEKDPKSDSVVVQFVYTNNGDNSIVQATGSEKDKYVIDYPVYEPKINQKSNSSEKEKEKSIQTLNTNKKAHEEINEPKPDTTKIQIAVTSLMPEEASQISGRWPKYFYDVFNPIQPFPELQHGRSNQINTEKIEKVNGDAYLPYYKKDRREPPYVAGPQIDPLSIYDREFNVPIFV